MLTGLRKWTVVVLAILCGFVLALLHALTTEFVGLASVAIAAFHYGNAVEHKTDATSGQNG